MPELTPLFRILVPCDCSELSWHALHVAAGLAAGSAVEIVLFIVSEPGQSRAQDESMNARLSEQLDQLPENIRTKVLYGEGRFVKAVLDAVQTGRIDLIVVGTKGARGWDGVFVGSHAEKIVRTSPVPVLTVPQTSGIARMPNVVVPLRADLRLTDIPACIRQIGMFLKGWFHLLHVQVDGPIDEAAMLEQLNAYGRAFGLDRFSTSVEYADSEAEGILHFAAGIMADLIAIATQGDPDPDHMFRPSIAADVVNHARIPVWTCLHRPDPVTLP